MGFIPEEIVEEVRQSNDIFSIVSDYLRLKKQGKNYVGLCPFHQEKTPSFTVSPEKQIFYCFGCSAGGNVISFVMQMENLSFPEAVRFLADKSGITIPGDQDPQEGLKYKERERAYELNGLVKNFFRYILNHHEVAAEARNYLKRRGIDEATAEKFQLGFAPPGWDGLLNYLLKKGYHPEYLEKQGLVLKKSQGKGYYDRFRNRVIFPIWNHKNNVIGFGGRVLDDSLPKYLNSPETNVFNKSNNLYGINFAIPAIRELDSVIIVEGYLDVITCHQFGIKNVVASLGTAMTREQGKFLARYTQKVYIAYDTDAAGVAATLRGMEILQDVGCRVKVITIPSGKDPDELIRNRGPEAFLELVRHKSKSLIKYKLDDAMVKFDPVTIEGKLGIVSEIIPYLLKINSDIEKEEQLKIISTTLGISPQALWGEIKKYQIKNRKNRGKRDKIALARDNTIEKKAVVSNTQPKEKLNRGAREKAEENIIKLLLNHPELFPKVKAEIGVNFTNNPEYLIIIKHLDEAAVAKRGFEPAAIIQKITDLDASNKISALLVDSEPPGDLELLLSDYIKVIADDEVKTRREQLLRQLEEAEQVNDVELRDKLLREYSKLL